VAHYERKFRARSGLLKTNQEWVPHFWPILPEVGIFLIRTDGHSTVEERRFSAASSTKKERGL